MKWVGVGAILAVVGVQSAAWARQAKCELGIGKTVEARPGWIGAILDEGHLLSLELRELEKGAHDVRLQAGTHEFHWFVFPPKEGDEPGQRFLGNVILQSPKPVVAWCWVEDGIDRGLD